MFVQNRDSRVRAYSRCMGRKVVCSRGGNPRCAGSSRIDAVAEIANHAKDFEMSKARFRRSLEDKVRRGIKGVSGGAVIQPASRARRPKNKILRVPACREESLRILNRSAEPEFVGKILDDTEPKLPRPAEANVILRVDGHRQNFGTVVQALPRFRYQAPYLPTRETEAVVQCRLPPDLPLAECIAMALVVIGGDTR